MNLTNLEKILTANRRNFGPVIDARTINQPAQVFDFTESNSELRSINFGAADEFSGFISGNLRKNNCRIGFGRYNEERIIYQTDIYKNLIDRRTIHLGIDIWLPAGTDVMAPLGGAVHSFADNAGAGDYGPTIIIRHHLRGTYFYTLYGHLSRGSLKDLRSGQEIVKGQVIGRIGRYRVNGGWPPHLHFQVISDMLGKFGDYYGVCSRRERRYYLNLCPNPNLILNNRMLD